MIGSEAYPHSLFAIGKRQIERLDQRGNPVLKCFAMRLGAPRVDTKDLYDVRVRIDGKCAMLREGSSQLIMAESVYCRRIVVDCGHASETRAVPVASARNLA